MHICFATLDYPTTSSGGGVATVTHLLAQALVANGHKVSVIRLGQDMPAYKDGLVQIHSLSQGSWHYYVSRLPLIGKHLGLPARELERSFRIAQKLKVLHDKDPIDIIEFSEEAVFFSAFSPLRNSCVYVARLHGTEYAWVPKVPGKKLSLALKMQRALQRYFLKRCPYLIAVSQFYKDDLKNDLGTKTAERMVVLGNPIEEEPLAPTDLHHKQETPTFLFVGRIQDAKGIDLLLRALGRLKSEGLQFSLQIAGGHHPSIGEQRFNQMLEESNLQNRVKLLGYKPEEQVRTLMRQVTAVVVPSYFETFGLVGIEALQEGARLIHSRVGTIASFKENEHFDLKTFEPGNESQLCEILRLSVTRNESTDEEKISKGSINFTSSLQTHITFYNKILKKQKCC